MIRPKASNIKVGIFGKNHDMWDMIRPETTNMKIRLSDNNDNLWDMSRPEKTNVKIRFAGDNDNLWDMIRPEDTNTRLRFVGDNENIWDMVGTEDTNMKIRLSGNNDNLWDMIRPEDTNTEIRFAGNNDNLWDMIRPEDANTRLRFVGDNENIWDMVGTEDTNMKIRLSGNNDNMWDMIRPEATNIRIKFPSNNENFWGMIRPETTNTNIRFPGNNDNLWEIKRPVVANMNIRLPGNNDNLWDMIRPEDTNMNIRFAGDNDNFWETVRPEATNVKIRLPENNKNIWDRLFQFNPFTPKLVKQGVCPIPSLSSVFQSMVQGCDNNCMVDSDCPGNRKCCITACGFGCIEPFIPSQNTRPKSGTCPSKVLIDFTCSQPRRECIVDHDCPASSKCCLTSCGPTCLQPQALPVEPVNMVVMPPTCSADGGFAAAQSQGELSWCVDDGGNPLHNTLTRGLVTCDAKGRILERQEIDPVCPGYDNKPRVCTDECVTAYCPQHPDAVCVADPCRDCATTFVNQAGEKVLCEDKCSQPLAVGNCRSSLPRYFYNKTSGSCEQFNFGGCEGNDNNFESLEKCYETCEQEVPMCDQPRDIGLCRGYVPRWFYNHQTHTCEEFIYGGCGGNKNNFETKEECDARCPDLVLCPWTLVKGQNLEPCSRLKSCINATCPANPDAVCTADPCSCEAMFVNNQTGKPVECFGESTSEPAHIVTPTVPRHTRCENTRRQHLADKTLENSYIAQCDLNGQFLPIQCAVAPNSVLYDEECWCVDEAGIQLPGTTIFPHGSQNCEPVKVKRVEVTLAFKHRSMDQAASSLDHVKR
ncbi:uncharacterized protein LOC111088812 [Limulus polyphemus]|uniref:Uncharacterized protein LOC111088812 n=1 Tax=Limulus polyphemus TaxID=6850 RepID=A0ABM1TI62_LIMPO|nr:uncharacterized protein LOC111088812 [Limulus polyphemus]